ncbi:dual specificity protein phosphatase [Anaeramoeba flamelloides]|uniref:protein-tyrosine-phosphatase n=1 Tax=Anaeramoeba flamelloides TaxID=1746091 RepID=A0AAV7Y221_9EUKA|nr:dual specificity protein phosphatase [Anaeramoeba flamelloides]
MSEKQEIQETQETKETKETKNDETKKETEKKEEKEEKKKTVEKKEKKKTNKPNEKKETKKKKVRSKSKTKKRRGSKKKTSTSTKQPIVKQVNPEEKLNSLTKDLFTNVTEYAQGQFKIVKEDFTALQEMNELSTNKYSQMKQKSSQVLKELHTIEEKESSIKPYLDSIDTIVLNVDDLYKTVQELDSYSKNLQQAFVQLENSVRDRNRKIKASSKRKDPMKSTALPTDISQITKQIYLSDYFTACNERVIKKYRISHIVRLLEDPNSGRIENVTYFYRNWEDTFSYFIIEDLIELFNFVGESLKTKKNRILFHCFAGVSRSSSAVISYLMRKKNCSYEKAHKLVHKKRPIIFPNSSFVFQLKLWKEMGFSLEGDSKPHQTYNLLSSQSRIWKIYNNTLKGILFQSKKLTEKEQSKLCEQVLLEIVQQIKKEKILIPNTISDNLLTKVQNEDQLLLKFFQDSLNIRYRFWCRTKKPKGDNFVTLLEKLYTFGDLENSFNN